MEKKASEIVDFNFNIRRIRYPDCQEDYLTRIEDEGISTEIVVMQLKAYLRLLEEDYIEDFKNSSARFKQE